MGSADPIGYAFTGLEWVAPQFRITTVYDFKLDKIRGRRRSFFEPDVIGIVTVKRGAAANPEIIRCCGNDIPIGRILETVAHPFVGRSAIVQGAAAA